MAEANGHFEVLRATDMVICKSALKTRDFMLAPAAMKVDKKQTTRSLFVRRFDLAEDAKKPLFISSQFRVPMDRLGQVAAKPWVLPV